jgi:hypothetical protein
MTLFEAFGTGLGKQGCKSPWFTHWVMFIVRQKSSMEFYDSSISRHSIEYVHHQTV